MRLSSVKTYVINCIRRIFTIGIFERWLLKHLESRPYDNFSRLIPSERFYKPGSLRHINKSGINYKLDISNIVDNFIYFGISEGYAPILDKIRSANVILDIGANIGSTSLFFAKQNTKASIFSFEPHPKIYQRALENISLNDFDHIELIRKGLGDKKDKVKLFEVNPNNPGMNRILNNDNENFPFFEIEIDTVDSFVAEKNISVDFIKIDVEGYELSVLKGAKKTLLQNTPLIHLELDNNNLTQHGGSAKDLIQFLYDVGYKKIYKSDDLRAISIEDNLQGCHFDLIAHA